MYFAYFQYLSIKIPAKFEKYMELLGIFGNTISKCKDLIGKSAPLPDHSLYSSPSMELKLFHLHYETPCICKMILMYISIIFLHKSTVMKIKSLQRWMIMITE